MVLVDRAEAFKRLLMSFILLILLSFVFFFFLEMARIWEKAVKFIEENESRIRTEVQQVWGEDTAVWRWLGPTLSKSQTSFQENSDSGNESANQLYPDL